MGQQQSVLGMEDLPLQCGVQGWLAMNLGSRTTTPGNKETPHANGAPPHMKNWLLWHLFLRLLLSLTACQALLQARGDAGALTGWRGERGSIPRCATQGVTHAMTKTRQAA